MVHLREMIAEEFAKYSAFSLESFVEEMAKSSRQPVEEIRKSENGLLPTIIAGWFTSAAALVFMDFDGFSPFMFQKCSIFFERGQATFTSALGRIFSRYFTKRSRVSLWMW
jgi:hypothetical protein